MGNSGIGTNGAMKTTVDPRNEMKQMRRGCSPRSANGRQQKCKNVRPLRIAEAVIAEGNCPEEDQVGLVRRTLVAVEDADAAGTRWPWELDH